MTLWRSAAVRRCLKIPYTCCRTSIVLSSSSRQHTSSSSSFAEDVERTSSTNDVCSIPSFAPPPGMFRGASYLRTSPLYISPSTRASTPRRTNTVIVKGLRSSLDSAAPLMDAETLAMWRLDRMLMQRQIFLLPNASQPVFLLPPHAEITSLGTRMRYVDLVYRQKGFFSPSEMAEVFFAVVPTYYVEMRHIIRALPPHLLLRLEKLHTAHADVGGLLQRYPMLFDVRRPRYHRAGVRLNSDFWFVRHHPLYGSADSMHQHHNATYHTTIGGKLHRDAEPQPSSSPSSSNLATSSAPPRPSLDASIFAVLLRHLPRVPSPPANASAEEVAEVHRRRHATFSLATWMRGFSAEEMRLMERISPSRLVHLIARFTRIFQLVSPDGSEEGVFYEHHHHQHSGQPPPEEEAPPDDDATAYQSPEEAACGGDGAFSPSTEYRPRSSDDVSRLEDDLMLQAADFIDGTPPTTSNTRSSMQQRPPAADTDMDQSWNDEMDDDGDELGNWTDVERIHVRRLPPHMAPRSLSSFNTHNTPDAGLLTFVCSFLCAPPSVSLPLSTYLLQAEQRFPHHQGNRERVWRWVRVSRIYDALTPDLRHALRSFRGLPHFLRLHGELFELSEDYAWIIVHDPAGVVAPLVPVQRRFRWEERMMLPANFDDDVKASASMAGLEAARQHYEGVLGESQIPTTRAQIQLLDPHNPLLRRAVLDEELADELPATGAVPLIAFLRSLPPILRASFSARYRLASSPLMVVWSVGNRDMVQRRTAGPAPMHTEEAGSMPVEEAVAAVLSVVPDGGATIRALSRMHIPPTVLCVIDAKCGSLLEALEAYPHYFDVEPLKTTNGDRMVRPRSST